MISIDELKREMTFDSLIESQCYSDTSPLIGVEDAGLRADDQLIFTGFSDPFDVVRVLQGDVLGQTLADDVLQHLGGDVVRHVQVAFQARRADPSERSESQRENVPNMI